MWSLRFVAGDIFCVMVCIYVCVKKNKDEINLPVLKSTVQQIMQIFYSFCLPNIISKVSKSKITIDK